MTIKQKMSTVYVVTNSKVMKSLVKDADLSRVGKKGFTFVQIYNANGFYGYAQPDKVFLVRTDAEKRMIKVLKNNVKYTNNAIKYNLSTISGHKKDFEHVIEELRSDYNRRIDSLEKAIEKNVKDIGKYNNQIKKLTEKVKK